MPRTKKVAGTAVDRRNGRQGELDGAHLERFPCPLPRPSDEALAVWELAWADPVSSMWTPSDGPILARWIEHYDLAARATRRANRKPVVLGSTGQPVEHPSYGTMSRSIAVIEKCEALLGFGALNRAKLGLTVGAARKSLADLNQGLMEAMGDADPDLD